MHGRVDSEMASLLTRDFWESNTTIGTLMMMSEYEVRSGGKDRLFRLCEQRACAASQRRVRREGMLRGVPAAFAHAGCSTRACLCMLMLVLGAVTSTPPTCSCVCLLPHYGMIIVQRTVVMLQKVHADDNEHTSDNSTSITIRAFFDAFMLGQVSPYCNTV